MTQRRPGARLLAGALSTALVAACGAPPDAPAPPAEAELIAADSAFATETAEGGAEAWTSWFEADGSMVRANGEIRGREAIRAAMEPALTDATRFTWTPERAIAGTGDMGVTIGSYTIADAETGELSGRGRYLTVWRRQADGSWKVVADIGDAADLDAAADRDTATPPDGE